MRPTRRIRYADLGASRCGATRRHARSRSGRNSQPGLADQGAHAFATLRTISKSSRARAKRNGVTRPLGAGRHEHNQIVYRHSQRQECAPSCEVEVDADRGMRHAALSGGRGIRGLPRPIWANASNNSTTNRRAISSVRPSRRQSQDIADLFHRGYGSDQDRADPVYLAQVMREHTRPLILEAEAGMTGANFAVAQTGASSL